ncbi:protein kinase [Candidatus Uabimicrobium sp. HlEnr_7]|uniref:serine/threonine-protein kinase n=1 Tax=Candidatus Uabimicrobium helgolandensis TaxID=3095367 RepID=UPI0035582A0B
MNETNKIRDLLDLGLESFPEQNTYVNDKVKKQGCLNKGTYLNQYLIMEELGRGGMGAVYRAHDTRLNRDVAIKIILQNTTKHIQKFLQEAKSVARLNHPNIVQIFEVCEEPICFFVMELVEGMSLDHFIRHHSKKLKNREFFEKIIHIFTQVANALYFTHTRKIIHRDIKPENIMLDSELKPKIMDFGLAKIERTSLVSVDEFAGTPMYMSPEQARNKKATKISDIYSLGATFYECLTTRTIFQGDTVFNILYQIIHKDPVAPRLLNPDIPKELEAICLKSLEKKPQKRYLSMKIFANDLQNYVDNKPIIAKPITRFGGLIKSVKRNKPMSSLVVSILVTILSTAFFIVRANQAELRIQKEILKQKEISAKEIAKKKEFIDLKKNLDLANMRIQNNNIKAATNDLKSAYSNYINSDFANPNDCIEFRWLKNKTKLFKYQSKAAGDVALFLKKKLITNSKKSKRIYIYSWQKGWQFEKIRDLPFRPTSICTDDEQKHFAILSRRELYLYDANSFEEKAKIAIPEKLGKLECCYFYDKNNIIVGGHYYVFSCQLRNSKFVNIKVIGDFSQGLVGMTSMTNTFSITKNPKNRNVFFVYSGNLYTYSFKKYKITNIHRITNQEIHKCYYINSKNCIMMGTTSGKIYHLDLRSNKRTKIAEHHSCVIQIKGNSDYLSSISRYGQIFIYDLQGNLEERVHSTESELKDIIFHGKYFSTINYSQTLTYQIPIQKNPTIIIKNSDAQYVELSGNYISTGSSFSRLLIYNTKTQKKKKPIITRKSLYSFVDSKTQNVLYINDLHDVYWKGKPLKETRSAAQYKFFKGKPIGGVFDKRKRWLYLYNRKAVVLIWDTVKEKIIDEISSRTLSNHESAYVLDAILTTNKYIIFTFLYYVNGIKPLCVLNLKTKKYQIIPFDFGAQKVNVTYAKICEVNSLILQYQDKIKIFDFQKLLQGKRVFRSLEQHKAYYSCFALAQNNKRLISIDVRNRILIWDISMKSFWNFEQKSEKFVQQSLLLELKAKHSISDCVYLPQKQALVTVGKQILLWKF